VLDGEDISSGTPDRNVQRGISLVQQGARVFRDLSIADNLLMAGYSLPARKLVEERREEVLQAFPRLRERYTQKAATLSGGERQALAFAMALMLRPKLLLIDEPSIGLAPKLVGQVFDTILNIRETLGSSVVIVEQQAQQVLRIAETAIVLRAGAVIGHGPASAYRDVETLRRVYLSETEEPVGV
jgi:branched-chain amino acid transport system ATP-binding protein